MGYTIADDEIKFLKTGYERERETLQGKLKSREQQLRQMEQQIKLLEQEQKLAEQEVRRIEKRIKDISLKLETPIEQSSFISKYDTSATLKKKIRTIMLDLARPMITGEIVSIIMRHEPEREDKKKLRVSVSATLSTGVKNGEFKRKKDSDNYYYTLG
jgi:hypothetical protein